MLSSFENVFTQFNQKEDFSIHDNSVWQFDDLIDEFCPSVRNRVYRPEVTLSAMMHQVLTPNGSLKTTLAKINADRFAQGLPPVSSNTGALARARSRLPTEVISRLAKGQYANIPKNQYIDEWLWNGLELKVIDGSTFTLADTPENREKYPQHGQQAEGVGFPIVRAVILQSISTGLIQDANFSAYKGKQTGEMSLAMPLLDQLTAGDLLLGDRYYPSYFVMAKLQTQLAHGVFQAHGARNIDFRKGKKLGSCDHLVSWIKPNKPSDMPQEEYDQYPDEITIRETQVTINKQKINLVSTLFDPQKYSASELKKLYKKRWFVELALRDIKNYFGMDHVDAKTPSMVEKEFWIHILSYNYVRWYMMNAAAPVKAEVDTLSFQLTVATVLSNEHNAINANKEQLKALQAFILATIASQPLIKRSHRKEPRAVKKRPKSYQRLKVPRKQWHAEYSA
ncbi:MAG: IS4 family transposase [Pseudoalteromonas sp.]|uniref:IS4 family transposase n=1 Tax=Pseudoalteromonas sp. TaxID=53249 RepID=UPI001DFEFC80|nr:IS4 family transposase [Pseudoalteromonas sp.]NRA81833.1 IS4 family transposase [Pseudoalteromonas sp.]